LDKNYRHQY